MAYSLALKLRIGHTYKKELAYYTYYQAQLAECKE